VNEIRDRTNGVKPVTPDYELIPFPASDIPHHTEYYRIVNANPELVRGFNATEQALRFVDAWLSTFLNGKRLITVTIRSFAFDPVRNSKQDEWTKFIQSLDANVYDVVIVPDVDQIGTYDTSPLSKCRAFWLGSCVVDLRYALYERAYLNLFVNNGPGTAASLDRKVRHLMFKLVVPANERSSEALIAASGFTLGGDPVYGTKFQRWIWEDDDFPVIAREFHRIVQEIELSDTRAT
jgi:hypothetical protein